MKEDGLETVKNKGRHDVRGKWKTVEEKWVDIVSKQSGDETCQWIKPSEHLSYQLPKAPFEICEDASVVYNDLLKLILYSSKANIEQKNISISLNEKGE